MKILHVIPYFYPAWRFGGPVRVAYDISRKLVERGHSVTVYTSDILDVNARVPDCFKQIDGINIFYFRNLSLYTARLKLFITPSMFSAFKKNAKSFDVVHIHGNRTTQSPLIHYFLRKESIPYVIQSHGGLPDTDGKFLKRLYDQVFGDELLRSASKVIAINQMEEKQYLNIGVPKTKIAILPNGLNLTDYDNLPRKGVFKRKYGLVGNKIVLYLGRLHKVKGLDILVRAFPKIINEVNNVCLVIVGPDDGYLRELKALVRELSIERNVLILNPLYGDDKFSAYVDSEVCVLPSSYEIFGMTLLESIACGTPVITSENCGLAEYLRDRVGIIVRSNSSPDLGAALLEMLTNQKKQRIFRNNCRTVINEFDNSKLASLLEKIYLDCN